MRPHEGQQPPRNTCHLRPEMPMSIKIIISCLLPFFIWSNAAAYSQQQNKFLTGNHHNSLSHKSHNIFPSHFFSRGGDSLVDDEDQMQEEEEEYDDVIDEEETEGEEEDVALTASSISAAQKVVKSRLAQGILERKSKPVKRRGKRNYSLLLKMPYILRALLNPFTVLSMTKSYFASLFNIDYMKEEDPSQNLRSALSAKARKGGNSSRPKPKRTFKPGQAKTLHDLPQLSA